MKSSTPFSGTLRYIYAHWPAYLAAYSGIILALIIIGVSTQQGWLSFIPLALALLLVLGYFLLASLWSAHQQYDNSGVRPHHVLFDMGQTQTTDTIIYIDLGWRRQAIDLSRRLTTGQVIVIDVYNPQWTSSRALARQRAHMPSPPSDPRIAWRNGRTNLLPLPDASVPAVILCQVASEFWQHGDRLTLLKEIHRILTPDGRVLLAERVKSRTNWLVLGPMALTLPASTYWRDLLTQAGFHPRQEQELQGVIHCFRADKSTLAEAQQLPFNFD